MQISAGKYDLNPARFYHWKDHLMNNAPEIFENRGQKINEDRIRAEKDKEIARLKETIAGIVQENKDPATLVFLCISLFRSGELVNSFNTALNFILPGDYGLLPEYNATIQNLK